MWLGMLVPRRSPAGRAIVRASTVAILAASPPAAPADPELPLGAMILVSPGRFAMGSAAGDPDEARHEVAISRAFYLMEHEDAPANGNDHVGFRLARNP